MGSALSHFNSSLIVRGKVTRLFLNRSSSAQLYHLTSPAICLYTHHPDHFVLPLKNFWLSHMSDWKVLMHDRFNTRLHLFGIHYHWRSASHLCYLLGLSWEHISSTLPFHEIILSSCVYLLGDMNCMFVDRVKDSWLSRCIFQCVCFGECLGFVVCIHCVIFVQCFFKKKKWW